MKPYLTIGRSSSCDIIVPDEKVSREHGRIYASGNAYIYENLGKNGTTINGQFVGSGKVAIAPGTTVLLAGRVPVPWGQIYSMLPLRGSSPYRDETVYGGGGGYVVNNDDYSWRNRGIEVGWGILAFIIPIAGWIMWGVWKDETPKRASQAAAIAWISFAINLVVILANSY